MGIFSSSHDQSEVHAPAAANNRLGTHGPILAPRRNRRLNWWEVLKLGAVTVSVGALQWIKVYFLMLEDRETRRRLQNRRGQHPDNNEQEAQKGFASYLSPGSRQAVIGMIDHIVTPLLVDQWRLSLVKVLLDPQEGPVLPEEDPDTRKALLASLQSYQAERDARPTFRPGQEPARYPRPSAQATNTRHIRQAGPTPERQPQAPGPNAVLAEHCPATAVEAPSAPPLYPDRQQLSASPPPDDWQLVDVAEEGPSAPPAMEECGVCLDAAVEVEIDDCRHKLCTECAKAICCLEGRAPQCPFCRGAMTGATPLSLSR